VSGVRKTIPLHSLFSEGRPDDFPVFHDGARLVTWREFYGRVLRASGAYARRAESSWLLDGDDFPQFAVDLFALLYAGKRAIVPPNTLPGTLRALSEAGAFEARCSEATPEEDGARRLEAIDPKAAFIDLYTSGSTGEPKRIPKTLAQFETEVAVLESRWGAEVGASSIVSTSPHQHIYGLLFRLFWPLSAGRTFDAVMCSHPGMLKERLFAFQDAVLVSSPAQLSRLPELVDLAGFAPIPKMIFSSGGPLPGAVAAQFYARWGRAPLEVFGSTETGGIAWRAQTGESGSECWTPFGGIDIQQSESGALVLTSPYLGMRPHEMEDRIALLPDGRFRSLGRLDRVAKIEEKRVSLPEMENRLCEYPHVVEAAVIPLSGRRKSLGAALVLDAEGRRRLATEGRRAVIDSLRRRLAENYEDVLIPRYWRFPESLPLNERGKISDDALFKLFANREAGAFLPVVVKEIRDEGTRDAIVLEIDVRRVLAYFAGHFPEMPILPGVVQVDWAVRYAKKYFSVSEKFASLENVKFLALVVPDIRLRLTLTWNEASKALDFAYADARKRYSSGRLVFGESAPA
jgi:3-hydroxymyristoyl/3-hydroxydecanoyl-(acyl carrier protein) dehydratase